MSRRVTRNRKFWREILAYHHIRKIINFSLTDCDKNTVILYFFQCAVTHSDVGDVSKYPLLHLCLFLILPFLSVIVLKSVLKKISFLVQSLQNYERNVLG